MRIIKKLIQVLSIVGSLVLFGCSSPESPAEEDNISSGIFSTPVVTGLKYSTGTQDGVTDINGSFKYIEGEIISFYIGDIFVGKAYAKNILTPLDLSEDLATLKQKISSKSLNVNDSWAINLFNLLLALDENGNADDGIEITSETIAKAASFALQLNLPPAEFVADEVTLAFTVEVNVILKQPAEVSAYISSNYSNNSDWGTMVWGISSWNNQ